MDQRLGRIESVDIRSIWLSEAGHFTPWLAAAENLALLGDTLGIELELEAQEKEVGPFRADILCKDTANETWVLIENQIEKTDHKHLGQLLTYAAGLKTVTIVWISTEFTEQHKAALDWLNEITNDSVRFFGVEVELWRIGNSPAAPKFNIISQPNDWQNAFQQIANDIANARPSEQLRIRYWSAFREYLQSQKSKLRPQKPSTNHWYNFSIGTSAAHLCALLISRDDRIGVQLHIGSDKAKSIFNDLLQRKTEIEAQLGCELEWKELPDKKVSKIQCFKSVDPNNEADWPLQFAFLRQTLEKFDAVFRPLFASASIMNSVL